MKDIQKWILAASCMLVIATPRLALPHAVIDEGTATAGRFSFVSLRVTHGCGTSATREIRVKIPEGVTRVSAEYRADWKIEKKMRSLEEPYENEAGQLVTETIDEIVWRGGSLPDGYYGVFQFRAMIPDTPGEVLWFKTIQNCDEGAIRWIEVPTRPDQNPYELKEPAPFLRVVASQ